MIALQFLPAGNTEHQNVKLCSNSGSEISVTADCSSTYSTSLQTRCTVLWRYHTEGDCGTIEPDPTCQNGAGCHTQNVLNKIDLTDTEIRCKELPKLTLNITFTLLVEMTVRATTCTIKSVSAAITNRCCPKAPQEKFLK